MSKTCMVNREIKRAKLAKKYAAKRDALKQIISSQTASYDEKAEAQAALQKLRVEVRTGVMVTRIDADGVEVAGERVAARTVLWGAGVRGVPLGATLGAPLDRGGRVIVEPDLSVPGHPEVFVIGDLAAVKDGERMVPGVAPAAIQGGAQAAKAIRASLGGRPRPAFRYRDKGSLATIGRSAAVAQIGRFRFSGYLAWLAWLLVHIMTLVGFRNRVAVLLDWAFQWFTWQRGARVVLENPPVEGPPRP